MKLLRPNQVAIFTHVSCIQRRHVNACRNAASPTCSSVAVAVSVRPSQSDEELHDVARMRAEAYYEEQTYSRFKQSFIKQFAEREYRRLADGVQSPSQHSSSSSPCITLVAIDERGKCIGSLDLRTNYNPTTIAAPPAASNDSVLQENTEERTSTYVMNVVVEESHRGRGVGRQLVHAAQELAQGELAAIAMYAHVEAVNSIASGLYAKCGFEEIESGGALGAETVVGERVLLRWRPHSSSV